MKRVCEMSPCLVCTRVADPENCENKNCVPWRNWFLASWERLRGYPRRTMDAPWQPVGMVIGGQLYAMPHLVEDYVKNDPCKSCRCGADQCRTPCRARQNWARAQLEVVQ